MGQISEQNRPRDNFGSFIKWFHVSKINYYKQKKIAISAALPQNFVPYIYIVFH